MKKRALFKNKSVNTANRLEFIQSSENIKKLFYPTFQRAAQISFAPPLPSEKTGSVFRQKSRREARKTDPEAPRDKNYKTQTAHLASPAKKGGSGEEPTRTKTHAATVRDGIRQPERIPKPGFHDKRNGPATNAVPSAHKTDDMYDRFAIFLSCNQLTARTRRIVPGRVRADPELNLFNIKNAPFFIYQSYSYREYFFAAALNANLRWNGRSTWQATTGPNWNGCSTTTNKIRPTARNTVPQST